MVILCPPVEFVVFWRNKSRDCTYVGVGGKRKSNHVNVQKDKRLTAGKIFGLNGVGVMFHYNEIQFEMIIHINFTFLENLK